MHIDDIQLTNNQKQIGACQTLFGGYANCVIVAGGPAVGKTIGCVKYCFDMAVAHPKLHIAVVAQYFKIIERTAMTDYKNLLSNWTHSKVKGKPTTYNGQKLLLDNLSTITFMNPLMFVDGRVFGKTFSIAHVETDDMPLAVLDTILSRLRGPAPNAALVVVGDNPEFASKRYPNFRVVDLGKGEDALGVRVS